MLILSASRGSAEAYSLQRVQADASTGYLESYISRDWYRGSGVVARDPKLIYSCGHLFYEGGVWATDYEFYRDYTGYNPPEPGTGSKPRGFRYFSSYSDNVDSYGGDSSRAFAYDFTVFYGPNSFGPSVGYWSDGATAIRSSRGKRLVGYPATLEHTGDSGYSYQYATDWFPTQGYQIRDDYYGIDNVSTGEGTSGGPLFVQDTSSDDYYLGGILVSGSFDSAGIYALNSSSNSMASAALGLETVTRTYSNNYAFRLPDGASSYSSRKTTVAGFADTVSELKLSLSITTPRRGDLAVYLRSPSGRIRWVNKPSSSTADNLVVNQADYSSTFRGYATNGVWQVKMRDSRTSNRATFRQFSVTVTAFAE